MTESNIFGHTVEREVDSNPDSADIGYRCDCCGLYSNEVHDFERYGCDEHRNRGPADE